MAKPPAWMHVSEQRVEGNKVFVNIRVRMRHPAFLTNWNSMCKSADHRFR